MARAAGRPAGPNGQTVLVLGGGIGGIVAANRLRRRLGRRHRIVLVNRDADFSLAASYLWVLNGSRTTNQITRPLGRLRRRGIEVVIGEVQDIDPAGVSATVDGGVIEADQLVVSLGADYSTDSIGGLAEFGETFATAAGAERLHREVGGLERGRVLVVTGAPVYKCPAAPYEAAMLIDSMLRRRGVRGGIDIAVHSAEPAPMGVAGQNVSAAVKEILGSKQIDYRPSHQIVGAEAGEASFSDGSVEPFDLLAYMPPIAPPGVVRASALAGESGWIDADRHTMATRFDRVFAIGDNVAIPLSIGKPLPRAGVFAHAQGIAVADNIANQVEGKPLKPGFDGRGGCFIETGDGRAGYGSGTFYSEPAPKVNVRQPSRLNHLGKVAFEKNVLWRWL